MEGYPTTFVGGWEQRVASRRGGTCCHNPLRSLHRSLNPYCTAVPREPPAMGPAASVLPWPSAICGSLICTIHPTGGARKCGTFPASDEKGKVFSLLMHRRMCAMGSI